MTSSIVCKCGQPCLLGSSKCHGCQHESMFSKERVNQNQSTSVYHGWYSQKQHENMTDPADIYWITVDDKEVQVTEVVRTHTPNNPPPFFDDYIYVGEFKRFSRRIERCDKSDTFEWKRWI